MAIYTRTGDDGTTALFGGKRLSKADLQIDAYGSLDELTSMLGVFITYIDNSTEAHFIGDIQRDLYTIMGFLADAPTNLEKQKNKSMVLEKKIDALTEKLPPLTHFILPRGSLASCWAHMARVSCRKAERTIIKFFENKRRMKDEGSLIVLSYLNRLSDLLFTYARVLNDDTEVVSK